eukprot:m.124249 g.124249  ORF g.124249 m.124249 type:complete len:252 (-) comp19733_c0_seq1:38-793(-)
MIQTRFFLPGILLFPSGGGIFFHEWGWRGFVCRELCHRGSRLHLNADNCAGQNKTYSLIPFLLYLLARDQNLEELEMNFGIVGHTKMTCDSTFGTRNTTITPGAEMFHEWKDIKGDGLQKIVNFFSNQDAKTKVQQISRQHRLLFKKQLPSLPVLPLTKGKRVQDIFTTIEKLGIQCNTARGREFQQAAVRAIITEKDITQPRGRESPGSAGVPRSPKTGTRTAQGKIRNAGAGTNDEPAASPEAIPEASA